MTEQITVQTSTTGGHAIVSVSGEIDLSTAAVVRDAITTTIEDGSRHLIVDLTGVEFMDSTGLNLMITVHTELSPGSLRVVASRPQIHRVFTVTGTDRVIPLFDSVDAALEDASRSDSD